MASKKTSAPHEWTDDFPTPYLRTSSTGAHICNLCERRDCFHLPATERAALHKHHLERAIADVELRLLQACRQLKNGDVFASQRRQNLGDALALYKRTLRQLERSYDLLLNRYQLNGKP